MGHATLRTGGLPKSWQRKGCFPPHLQKHYVAELCLHAAKPDAFQQLNPFPCYFLFFLQRQSFGDVGFHGLMVQRDRESRGVGHGGPGRVNPNVPATVMFRQVEGQEGH